MRTRDDFPNTARLDDVCPKCGSDVKLVERETTQTFECINPQCAWTYDRDTPRYLEDRKTEE